MGSCKSQREELMVKIVVVCSLAVVGLSFGVKLSASLALHSCPQAGERKIKIFLGARANI